MQRVKGMKQHGSDGTNSIIARSTFISIMNDTEKMRLRVEAFVASEFCDKLTEKEQSEVSHLFACLNRATGEKFITDVAKAYAVTMSPARELALAILQSSAYRTFKEEVDHVLELTKGES